MDAKPRVAVYVCHCGVNIAAQVDVEAVAEFAANLPQVRIARHYPYMCSHPGQRLIKKDIAEQEINRVVVASCSPRMHEPTFRKALQEAGLNPFFLEMANIREHCSWVHRDRDRATTKAKKLVVAAVARVCLLEPLVPREVKAEPAALVIGGGIAGIQSALDIAEAGFKVYLVEQSPALGGRMAQLDKTFPTLDCSACILTPKMVDAAGHPNIELMTYSRVEQVDGYIGNFEVTVRKKARYVDPEKCTGCGDCARECRVANRVPSEFEQYLGNRSAIYLPFPQAVPATYTIDQESCLYLSRGKCGQGPRCVEVCTAGAINFEQQDQLLKFKVGSIIVATGFDVFDASRKPEYGYCDYPGVITSLEMERLISASGPTGGKIVVGSGDQKVIPKKVAFIQCVGSRDKSTGNEYCSRVCCMYTAKQAHLVKEKIPEAEVRVYYTDVRAFGKGCEEFYDRVRREGVRYIRGNPSEIFKRGDKLVIKVEDTLTCTPLEDEVDLVVLAVGLEPRKDSGQIGELLRLSLSPDRFFLEAHPKLRPVDTATEGIFLAGCCQGPKDIPDTVAQAKGAASSALIPLCTGKVKIGAQVAEVNQDTCRGCGYCVGICPYGAVELVEVNRLGDRVKAARVNEALCKGCGTCSAGCYSDSIQPKSFRDSQILPQIAALGDRT